MVQAPRRSGIRISDQRPNRPSRVNWRWSDHVVRIYEACNFQDLAGQRIGKVIATLIMVEERLVAMIARHNSAGERPEAIKSSSENLVNGPRLDGATGHASQLDIDAIFA